MATKGLSMRSIKELLKLRLVMKLNQDQVARAVGCGRVTVSDYERRVKEAGLDFATIEKLNEDELFSKLGLKSQSHYFKVAPLRKAAQLQPDWNHVNLELKKKNVTKMLVWQEYRSGCESGYSYSQFCEQYGRWLKKGSIVMRQPHKAGEKVFIDYAGTKVPIIEPRTKEILFEANIFVAVLGASSYTFVEATASQSMPDWLSSHRRMMEFFGGVPEILVPDNLKSGITKPDRYEARVNESYQDFARHYGSCVIPARVRRPKDKAKAEVGVLVVSRYILAALRNRIFYNLTELNTAISELLVGLNSKKMRHYNKSRRELFLELEASVLRSLPGQAFEYAEWKGARVNIDYHIVLEGHFYSAPYSLIGKEVELRATQDTVEILYRSERVASHRRSFKKGAYTTDPAHRPPSHTAHLEWTPERITQWAEKKGGPNVSRFMAELMKQPEHPEQAFRSALGVLRLGDKYTIRRLSLACARAMQVGAINY